MTPAQRQPDEHCPADQSQQSALPLTILLGKGELGPGGWQWAGEERRVQILMPVAVPASEAAMRTCSLESKYNDRASTWTDVPHLVGWGAFGPGGMLVLGLRSRSLTHASFY